DATLEADDAATLAFVAPETAEAATLTFELTVTDNDGATAKDSVDVAVAPVIELNGRVYDGPIANALVTITIDGRSYTATADGDGVYTLMVGAIDPDAVVQIRATGATGSEHIELMSIA